MVINDNFSFLPGKWHAHDFMLYEVGRNGLCHCIGSMAFSILLPNQKLLFSFQNVAFWWLPWPLAPANTRCTSCPCRGGGGEHRGGERAMPPPSNGCRLNPPWATLRPKTAGRKAVANYFEVCSILWPSITASKCQDTSIKADWIFIHKPLLEMDLYQDSTYIMYLYSYIYCSDI